MQYFNKDFTETYLKNYISEKPKNIRVSCGGWTVRVKIKMGVSSQALLTTKWLRVVEHEVLEPGNIVIFRFRKSPTGRLRLDVEEIYPCQACAQP